MPQPGELTLLIVALISIFIRVSRAYTRQVSASKPRAKVMSSGETPSRTSQECVSRKSMILNLLVWSPESTQASTGRHALFEILPPEKLAGIATS